MKTTLLLATGLTLLAFAPANGQTARPERPYRGIFGSGVGNAEQTVIGNASFSGGYDDNVLADATRRNSPQNSQEGALGDAAGGITYSLNRDRVTFGSSAGASLRYYPSLRNDYFKSYNASAGGSVRLLNKPAITLTQSIAYQPFTFLSVFPTVVDAPVGESTIPGQDFLPVNDQYIAYQGGLSLDHQLSRKVSFASNYDYRMRDRGDRSFTRQTASAHMIFGLTRNLNLRVGYRYGVGDYGGARGRVETHSPDIGLDFARALSLTRRTSLSFNTGTTAIVTNGVTRYRATGGADLDHEIGRSWFAGASYRRGLSYVETLDEPVFADSVSLALSGLITRRLQFQSGASASIGQSGFSNNRRYDTYRGVASLSSAITRYLNIGVNYAYYRYAFDSAIVLAPGVPRDINRQSIRAQVSLWAPLLNRSRRPNAAR